MYWCALKTATLTSIQHTVPCFKQMSYHRNQIIINKILDHQLFDTKNYCNHRYFLKKFLTLMGDLSVRIGVCVRFTYATTFGLAMYADISEQSLTGTAQRLLQGKAVEVLGTI